MPRRRRSSSRTATGGTDGSTSARSRWSSRRGCGGSRAGPRPRATPSAHAGQPESPAVKPFRDKAEGGHDMPWLASSPARTPTTPNVRSRWRSARSRAASRSWRGPTRPGDRAHPLLAARAAGGDRGARPAHLRCAAGALQRRSSARRSELRGRRPRTPRLPPDVAALVSRHRRRRDRHRARQSVATRTRRVPSARTVRRRDIRSGSRSTARGMASIPGSPRTPPPRATRTSSRTRSTPPLVVELPPAHRVELMLTTPNPVGAAPRHRAAASARSTPHEGVTMTESTDQFPAPRSSCRFAAANTVEPTPARSANWRSRVGHGLRKTARPRHPPLVRRGAAAAPARRWSARR